MLLLFCQNYGRVSYSYTGEKIGGAKLPAEAYELNRGLDAIKQRIEKIKARISRPIIVGVAGASGSGKTTVAAKGIQEMFTGSGILHMDDYFRGRRFMQSIRSDNWDEPRAFDLEMLAEHLRLLKQGIVIEKPIYSFMPGMREGYEQFNPAGVIILEGLFTLREPIVGEVDLKIFVEISVHGSLIRRILRDVGRTGQTEQDIFRQYTETVYPMYKLHIEPTQSRADILIVNQYAPEAESESFEIHEIQIKAALEGRPPKRRLEKLGFKKAAIADQEDVYYLAPSWEPPYSNELMRVRRENGRYFLAYKVRLSSGLLRIKQFEVEPSLKDALANLGYKKALSLKKRREKWLGDGVELAVDHIENDGDFIELRVSDPQRETQILAYLAKLGVKKKSITKKSYLEILLNP